MEAFEDYKKTASIKNLQEKRRAFMKSYEGMMYGIGIEGHMKKGLEWTKTKYKDSLWDGEINMLGELKNRTRIEFDGEEETAKKHLETTAKKLKEMKIGFIRSTHKGNSDYLWIEFSKPLTDSQKKNFLLWIAPKGSEVDLNFASSKKVFAVLFAPHWRHSYEMEMPVEFFEGNKIDYDALKIPKSKGGTKTVTGEDGFEYETSAKEEVTISDEELDKFKDPRLLDYILAEISKDHLEDNNLKMTVHLTHTSGLLKNHRRRQSFKVTGKTAEGKDNLQQASLKHLPDNSYLFVTSATQAIIEDDIKDVPILVISELNLFREGGANKSLLEVIKQRTEGGTTALKKDLRTSNKTLRSETGQQGVVTFGTIEAEDDEELGTRTMQGTIKATPRRIEIVNRNTFETFSDENKILSQFSKEDSWIKKGYNYFWKNETQYEVVLPYAKFLSGEIEGKRIFDNSDARSQRDVKRLLSLTCAMTWIHQEQRKKKQVNGSWFLVSEPKDLIATLKYSNEFFNQTYAGFDKRISEVLKFVESSPDWIDKVEIQQKAGVKHRGTINNYLWALESQGFIERSKGVHLNERFDAKQYKGNHFYYKSVQKASNKRLISVQLDKLLHFLEERSVQISVQNDIKVEEVEEKKGFEDKTKELSNKKGEIAHLKMNASSGKASFKTDFEEALQ